MWHRGFLGPSDRNGLIRVVNDGLVRFSIDGASVEMKYAESVTPNDNFTEWTIKLREGSKWSDGEPFTADDIMFWFNDVVNNKDLMPSCLPGCSTKTAARSRWRRWMICP